MLERLYNHERIALDFDYTLVDHKNSELLHDFVCQEWQRRSIWIVTHRQEGWAKTIWEDLEHASYGHLCEEMFSGAICCPKTVYAGHLVGVSDDDPRVKRFLNWKGSVCVQNKITALVDDSPDINKDGCLTKGVEFIFTDDLKPVVIPR